ncbi:MAG: organoarsenical effux MFS transporter ArsJ [Pseudomonadota bacterium]
MQHSARTDGVSAYIAVTAAYWAFMLTDGALRMLVLLHFHALGFSPIQLAYLFLLYEFMGMVTNLSAGWIAKRFGLTTTLYAGLGLQIVALYMLTKLDPAWSVAVSVGFVMAVQGLSGVAKDLAKMSSKSAVKLLAPSGDGALFRWVALLTGSKNAVKGLGFLLGAALLATLGFNAAIWAMGLVLTAILVAVAVLMPPGLPRGKKGTRFSEVFSKDRRVNLLSLARVFLFAARDVWFVVGIPIYFYSVLSDGTVEGNRIAFFQIGTFMALWIIAYGAVQSAAPQLLRAKGRPVAEIVRLAVLWVGLLTLILAVVTAVSWIAGAPSLGLTAFLIGGLLVFGFVFAVNSAAHSYLILAFSNDDRVTMDVGFYYMSNAAGRLLGTLLSGLSFQLGGLVLCLGTAAVMAGLSYLVARRLSDAVDRPVAA